MSLNITNTIFTNIIYLIIILLAYFKKQYYSVPNMSLNNSSEDEADIDPEFNNRVLDVEDYNLEELNLNISLNSS